MSIIEKVSEKEGGSHRQIKRGGYRPNHVPSLTKFAFSRSGGSSYDTAAFPFRQPKAIACHHGPVGSARTTGPCCYGPYVGDPDIFGGGHRGYTHPFPNSDPVPGQCAGRWAFALRFHAQPS